MSACRVRVRGHVQGVWFRESTRRVATGAGVAGWAENLPDGTVAIHLEGPSDAVDRVLEFVRTGPPDARVDEVEVEPADDQGLEGFLVR